MRVLRWLSGSLVLLLLLGGLFSQARAAEFYYDVYVNTTGLGAATLDISFMINGPAPQPGGNTFTATSSVLLGASMLDSPPSYVSSSVTGNGDLTMGPVTMTLDTSAPAGIAPEIDQPVMADGQFEIQVAFDTGSTNLTPLTGTTLGVTFFDSMGDVLLDNGLGQTATIYTYSDGTTATIPVAFPPGTLPGSTNPEIIGPFYNSTPEPSTGVLLGIATVMLGGWAGWRRRGAMLYGMR